jgi:hypothetical protein
MAFRGRKSCERDMPGRGPVLVDTNTIFECHRTGCWAGLAGAWPLETVEECITETQTAKHKKPPEQQIDEAVLRASFVGINAPTPLQLANEAFLRGPFLDPGERYIWAHALGREDAWVVCGPDHASMKFGVLNGMKDRLKSLEDLLTIAGIRPRIPLKSHFEEAWLRRIVVTHLFDAPKGGRK